MSAHLPEGDQLYSNHQSSHLSPCNLQICLHDQMLWNQENYNQQRHTLLMIKHLSTTMHKTIGKNNRFLSCWVVLSASKCYLDVKLLEKYMSIFFFLSPSCSYKLNFNILYILQRITDFWVALICLRASMQ